MSQDGLLIIISGASGTGKGTILNKLRCSCKNIKYSISATTRKPREGEIDGIHYFFKTTEEFKEMISRNQLIEWDVYCDNYYGTPKSYIEETLKKGFDVILEITIEGALAVMSRYPDCVSVFILPPSFEELERRIRGRATEKEDVILSRLDKARSELKQVKDFDYVIVNDDLETAVESFESIITSEKLKSKRNLDVINKFNLD